jgi:probable HAF family extracellular repeat protein
MTRMIRTAACTSVALSMFAVGTPATQRLSIVDLGMGSVASDINNRGQIVGSRFVWENGVVTELPPLPGEGAASAIAINDLGQIVGNSGENAVLWDRGTVILLVSAHRFDHPCAANAINNRGQILGSCNGVPFLWEDGRLTLLPRLPDGDYALTNGLNDFGQGVGGSLTETDEEFHAVLWHRGEVIDLGIVAGGSSSNAFAINNRGHIVGTSRDASDALQAVLWQNGTIATLETLPGARSTFARAINERGQIVGHSEQGPLLWEGGSLIELGGLQNGDAGFATGINDRGEIVGSVGPSRTSLRAVLWTNRPQG